MLEIEGKYLAPQEKGKSWQMLWKIAKNQL